MNARFASEASSLKNNWHARHGTVFEALWSIIGTSNCYDEGVVRINEIELERKGNLHCIQLKPDPL